MLNRIMNFIAMPIIIKTILFILLFFACFIVSYPLYIERCSHDIQKVYLTFSHIKAISQAVEKYKSDNGIYPSNLALLSSQYIHHIPSEVWGGEYIYKIEGDSFNIYSLGYDQKLGGNGASVDIDRNTKKGNIISSILKPVYGCEK